ncbi:putative protein serine/threonine kinase [Tieghemostelium lacteum]|uniref:non-specific serine/threonine protein kinase n=1 Tax=Tieghemostelium lacteum TaxID=361077 RepID=A0A151ZEA3_TIELA|nr:putative protein serine/threonine kinase [Tieghemostelium lacteum]|eukprot:KYQ92240.1 putative protein serine/threonine kinase [Tieghemostelium lacteum]
MASFLQKVIKSPSTTNLLSSIHSNGGSNSVGNASPHSSSANLVSSLNSSSNNAGNSETTTPPPPSSSQNHELIRSDSSISIQSNGSSNNSTLQPPSHQINRNPSNNSIKSDDSSGMSSPINTMTSSDQIVEEIVVVNNSDGTQNEKKLTRKIAQFISSPKLDQSVTVSTPESVTSPSSHGSGNMKAIKKALFSAPDIFFGSKQKKSGKKPKKAKFNINTEISTPYNVVHKMHVDFDLKWTGHNDFKLDEKLGDGAYGSVYKGTHKDLGFTLAIKVIEMKQAEAQSLQNEINILKNCKSPNVVSYFGSLHDENNVWILMDFCALGSIRDIIESTEKTLNESQIAFVVKNTLQGLIYLHTQAIIHRDVKAANILLSDQCEVKIADFGVSEKLTSAFDQSKEMIGTPLWMAPEVILKKNYDYKADVWSLGITIIEMADGIPPHINMNPMRAMKMVPNWPPPTFNDPKKWSPLLNDFLAKCLDKDPEKRSSPSELLHHPFLRKVKGPEVLGDLVSQLFRIKKKKFDESKKQQQQQQHQSQSPPQSPIPHSETVESDLSSSSNHTNNNSNNNNVILATATIGTMIFKGSYTTCREIDEEDEDQEDEDQEEDPFSTTVFHKKPTTGTTVDEDQEEEEDEDDPFSTTVFHKNVKSPVTKDDSEESDQEDEEYNGTGTMVFSKPKAAKGHKRMPSVPTKPLPSLPPNRQSLAGPQPPLVIEGNSQVLSSSSGVPAISTTSSSNVDVHSQFEQMEIRILSLVDNQNKLLANEIKKEIKSVENTLVSYFNMELKKLQNQLGPIQAFMEEYKKSKQPQSSQQPQTVTQVPIVSPSPIQSNSVSSNLSNSSSTISPYNSPVQVTKNQQSTQQQVNHHHSQPVNLRSNSLSSSSNSSFRPLSAPVIPPLSDQNEKRNSQGSSSPVLTSTQPKQPVLKKMSSEKFNAHLLQQTANPLSSSNENLKFQAPTNNTPNNQHPEKKFFVDKDGILDPDKKLVTEKLKLFDHK